MVLRLFGDECRATGKEKHSELLLERIIRPALEGCDPPPLQELAQRLELTEKQAANCLLTARRAFQRILRAQLAACVGSEAELAAEIQDLFDMLGKF